MIDRKKIRLTNYDYSTPGVYFITICTRERKPILGNITTATTGHPYVELSEIGNVVNKAVQNISEIYPEVKTDKYVIMPEHIHLLIRINEERRPMVAATVSRIVNQFKGAVTKQLGISIWQRSYIDRVVRNRKEYDEIWKYIENNPIKRYLKQIGV